MTEPTPTYRTGQTFGRPRLADEPMQPVTVRLTAGQIEWLDQHSGATTEIRRLIDQAIQNITPSE
jgi:hypothetical protein